MVSAGNAIRIRIDVANSDHMNIGMRIYVMPGARIAMIVVRKFRPVSTVEVPDTSSPITHQSIARPGVKYRSVRFA